MIEFYIALHEIIPKFATEINICFMKKHLFVLLLFIFQLVTLTAQTRTIVNLSTGNTTASALVDKEINISGKATLHITNTTNALTNSVINIQSDDAWVYFDNIRPQTVVDSLLRYVKINGANAVQNTNTRVAIYRHGAAVAAQTPSIKPLKVFSGQQFTGDSVSYSMFGFYTALGSMDNKIRSFKLKKGYMATMAITSNGTGYSRVFIADEADLEIAIMPALLDQKVSFIRVTNWEWVSKKGWAGSSLAQYKLLNCTWRYDWSAGGSSSNYVEYVPIRQNAGWPSWSEISGKTYVSHVLGYNEPDHVEQSNVTVEQALAQWPEMMKTGLRIGSPATTDFSWLYRFMDSCRVKNYRVDYVVVHAYWGNMSPTSWYNNLKYVHQKTGRPIWIKEWNNGANWTNETWPTADRSLSAANAAKQLNDLKGILNVMDTASFIERYSIYNWVQDCRAMVLADTLTPAGKYYASTKPAQAFNRRYEVIPTFVFANPTLSITPGDKKVTLTISDPNLEYYDGYILEKKTDNGSYGQLAQKFGTTEKIYTDTIDFTVASKVRYRVKTRLMDGTYTGYSNETGWDATNGNDTIQYGVVALSDKSWSTVLFRSPYAAVPVIITGSPTINNSTILMTPRTKLVNLRTHFNLQLAPWQYQTNTTFIRDENLPFAVFESGKSFDFNGLKAQTARVSVGSSWVNITFPTAFDTIPVVFMNQTLSSTTFPTNIRVRNITKTGFQARMMREKAVTSPAPAETVGYLAITPGVGSFNNKRVIVGSTADNAVGTNYALVNFKDSVPNPVFISQMQTCNDDSTAALRVVTLSAKTAYLTKQKERSTSSTITSLFAEKAGWMVIGTQDLVQTAVENVTNGDIQIAQNPVRNELYFSRDLSASTSIEIFNLYGCLVKREIASGKTMNVSGLASGCYLLRMNGKKQLKFIKE